MSAVLKTQERPDLSDSVKQVCLVFSRLMGCNVLQLSEGGGNAPGSCLYAAHTVCLYRERFNNGALRSLKKPKRTTASVLSQTLN